ncbi:TetR/AcrR family transcriptional regulator [Methanosarcina sp. Z-7115]|uniref:TetR/AcrR family transcriptional regulator n=1 Tax=Methanosarcina baikalica TaxID=3073890 RepID=A0ABU2CZ98_9EURY|nr:TetR/AcrR family transcriptional regulator [Methanosarcina sp. Z-7115]MDR7665061.1 TetR/AcrR family transcriptional regulator [Methanosarcina sp. Z-7115]
MSTEQRILEAALKIFASEGYTGATTRRIAEEANVAEVTLFRKFQSKENLLREVLIQNRTAFSALDTLFLIEKNADLETDLRILGKNIIKVMKDKKNDGKRRMLMFMLFEEGRRRPEVAEILSSFIQMNIRRLSEYFELQIKNGKMRNINPRSAAITFVSYFVYTSLLRGVVGDSFLGENDEEIERFIDIFTKGILKVED